METNNISQDQTRLKIKTTRSYRTIQPNIPNYITLTTVKQLLAVELNIYPNTILNQDFVKRLCYYEQSTFIYDLICLKKSFISLYPHI